MLPRASTREVSMQLKVTTKQILLTANCTAEDDEKCKQAMTTLIALQITPTTGDAGAADTGSAQRVELSFKSGMGGGCNERPVGCVFDKEEISAIKCPGYMVKKLATSRRKTSPANTNALRRSTGMLMIVEGIVHSSVPKTLDVLRKKKIKNDS